MPGFFVLCFYEKCHVNALCISHIITEWLISETLDFDRLAICDAELITNTGLARPSQATSSLSSWLMLSPACCGDQ